MCSCAAPSRRAWRRDHPFARGSAQPDRHLHLIRCCAISASPQARTTAEICAHSRGYSERAHVARGVSLDLKPKKFGPILAHPSSSPDNCRCRLLGSGPQILGSRMNILSLQAVFASMHIEPANKDGRSDNTGVHIRGEAGCGGAHGRAWVRVRATAGVWQACGGGSQRLLTCRSYRRGSKYDALLQI